MRVIISENQLKLLIREQTTALERSLDRKFSTVQGATEWHNTMRSMIDNLNSYCKANKSKCYLAAEIGLWFVPYVGPYLSAAVSTAQGIEMLQEGKTAEGIIAILISPLMLAKTVRILKATGASAELVDKLSKINKSGAPILMSKTKEEIANWLVKNLGNQKYITELLQKIPTIIAGLKNEIKNALLVWKKNNEKLYREIISNPENKKRIESIIGNI